MNQRGNEFEVVTLNFDKQKILVYHVDNRDSCAYALHQTFSSSLDLVKRKIRDQRLLNNLKNSNLTNRH